MNEEMSTMFANEENVEAEEVRKAREKALAEKRKADEKFLNECKCFKDFMMGKEEEFAKCKDYIIKYIFQTVQLGGAINADFIAGIRLCLEMLEELPGKWDNTFARLGQEE